MSVELLWKDEATCAGKKIIKGEEEDEMSESKML
jgi:hypothetical protein